MGKDGLPVVLGQGGFGVVCLGRLRGAEVAVKVSGAGWQRSLQRRRQFRQPTGGGGGGVGEGSAPAAFPELAAALPTHPSHPRFLSWTLAPTRAASGGKLPCCGSAPTSTWYRCTASRCG
jgi:hypothetical protein